MLQSPVFLGASLLSFSVLFPPFDDITEVDLSLHMLQHVLLVLSGVLIAYPLFRRGRLLPLAKRGLVLPAFAVTASLIVYWHLPSPWDSAVSDPAIHVLEHCSFLLAGLLIGSTLQLLSDSSKVGALLAAFFGHMFYALLLVSPLNTGFYPLYSLSDQATLGWVLLLTGPSLLVGVAYLAARNPGWLEKGTQPGRRYSISLSPGQRRLLGRAAGSLSVSMVLVLVVYFGLVLATVGSGTANSPPGRVTVFIEETPFSWSFSPQSVKVVIGVNNTVLWVSRSVSFDTVTGAGGVPSSGPIAPGQTYEYTFTKPGTYPYRCVYHPWMTGEVVVLPADG